MSRNSDLLPFENRRREAAAIAVLLVLAGVYFAVLETTRPYYFLWDDNTSYFLPNYVYNYESLTTFGTLAHVNYHQYLGHTHLASGQPAVLYPPLYAALALTDLVWGDLRPVIDVLAVLHLAAAALGMYLLLRSFRVGRAASVGTALLWMSFPFLPQVSRNWIVVAYVAAYLPWNLWLLERLLARPGAARVLALAAVKALLIFQGYVQYPILLALFEGVYLSLRFLSERGAPVAWWRQALSYAAAQAASAALAAPLLLPMLHAKTVSAYRAGSLSFAEFISNALDPGTFLRTQLWQMEEQTLHLSTSALYYLGIPNLIVLGALFLRRRKRPFAIPAAVAAVALVLSTPAYGVMYHVPILSSFRWPFKSFLICLFFLAVALGGAFDALLRDRRRGLRAAGAGLLAAGLVTHVFLVLARDHDKPFGPNRVEAGIAELRAAAARRFPLGAGRVVSLWMNPQEPEIHRLLVFNHATLVGAFHLGGYEPLISQEHLELAVRLEYSNIFRYELTREALDYLSSWSVRFLMAPDRERLGPIFARFPQLRLAYRGEGLLVYENAAAEPFAYLVGDGGATPLAVEWRPDGVRLETAGRGGLVRLAVAPLDGYVYSVDGRDMGPVAYDEKRHVVVEVPAGTQVVEVRYVDVPFLAGAGVFAVFLLAVASTWGLRRWRRPRSHGEDQDKFSRRA